MSQARNWWGTAWVEKIERLAESTRLAQGQHCARSGLVGAIKFDGRTISAKVQGAKKEPEYMVRISFDPFVREEWDRLLAELRSRSSFVESLAAGDLPLETQTAFSKAKLRFMPERYVDLHLECACPDWLKPCKHLVALWLKFGRDFENDPFLVFELRGLLRDELVVLLRGRTPAGLEDEGDAEEDLEGFPEFAVHLVPEALPVDPASFWAAPALPEPAPESPARLLLDDDIFEKLCEWPGIEAKFRQIYDSVYELATRLRS